LDVISHQYLTASGADLKRRPSLRFAGSFQICKRLPSRTRDGDLLFSNRRFVESRRAHGRRDNRSDLRRSRRRPENAKRKGLTFVATPLAPGYS